MPNMSKKALSELLNKINPEEPEKQTANPIPEKEQKPDTAAYGKKLIHIPYEKIRTNTKNDYPISEIEELMELLLEVGLIEPPSGIYDMEEDTYILESGERRYTAIGKLMKKYEGQSEDSLEYQSYLKYIHPFAVYGVPFLLEKEADSILSEERLIIANEGSRTNDPVHSAQKTARLMELKAMRQKNLPKAQQKNLKTEVAQQLGITERQVRTRLAVATLLPELQELMTQRHISLEDGAKYAKLDEEAQRFLVELLTANESEKEKPAYSNEEILKIKEKADILSGNLKKKENENKELKEAQQKISLEKQSLEEKISHLQEQLGSASEHKPDEHTLRELTNLKKQLDTAAQREEEYKRLQKKEREEKQKLCEELNALKSKPPTKEKPELDSNDKKIIALSIQIESCLTELQKGAEKLLRHYKDYRSISNKGKESSLNLNTLSTCPMKIDGILQTLQKFE